MSVLLSSERSVLESAVLSGRSVAEVGVSAALSVLGVGEDRRPAHLDEGQSGLRLGLRARQRQLGGDWDVLMAECAYEQWHRLLFARFLAENGLLIHPGLQVPVSLADCEELAAGSGEHADGWSVAAAFAAEILPGIFRLDDPAWRLSLAAEHRVELEAIVEGLPAGVFVADDSLGWVYQYWQSKAKDEVNASERKIGGADLGPVTQLFTENYMVRFLLENSLGAWWAARNPDSGLQEGWEFLRFDDETGEPAAGTFEGWPDRVAEVTVMDPCCGSGHFLVEAFKMLWAMRAEEEDLSDVAAQDAVLADNLFGLELDPRCVQIAMFAVALQAWKDGGGWRPLPTPNIACSGIAAKAQVEEWTALADGDPRLETALGRLHTLFRDADTLGSLIDPRRAVEGDGDQPTLEDVNFDQVAPLLEQAAARETDDPASAVLGHDAAGTARAAALLSRTYTLIATNPPFLGQNRQASELKRFVEEQHYRARHDLSIAVLDSWWMSRNAAGVAVVSPSEWQYLGRYEEFRVHGLKCRSWRALVRLGFNSFTTTLRASPCLLVSTDELPSVSTAYFALDLEDLPGGTEAKYHATIAGSLTQVNQLMQLNNPDSRVMTEEYIGSAEPLSDRAKALAGLSAGDSQRFDRLFWEVPKIGGDWERFQSTVSQISSYHGRSKIVFWQSESGDMAELAESVRHLNHAAQNWRRGKPSWGKKGVAVSLMGELPVTIYSGDRYDINCCAVVPESEDDLLALWAFMASGEFSRRVRQIDQSLKLAPKTLLKVPFDVERWRQVAAEDFSEGLPEPWSDDPTQWLFEADPAVATEPLQVAVGRLVGFRWPEQPVEDGLDGLVDDDGIVCVPSVLGEPPAVVRIDQVLSTAFGDQWSPGKLGQLLEASGSKRTDLDDWLYFDFFAQHCKVFSNRPFVWHITDGRKDGFAALVNYHRLDRANLERLAYTYLGDWIERQKAGVEDGTAGAEDRLAAALELQTKLAGILEGEPPFDIYVRWKGLSQQPIGWNPDLDDGVRLNIRPFVQAGVLRRKFSIHWHKDRGKNPDGSTRENDLHHTIVEKRQARQESA